MTTLCENIPAKSTAATDIENQLRASRGVQVKKLQTPLGHGSLNGLHTTIR